MPRPVARHCQDVDGAKRSGLEKRQCAARLRLELQGIIAGIGLQDVSVAGVNDGPAVKPLRLLRLITRFSGIRQRAWDTRHVIRVKDVVAVRPACNGLGIVSFEFFQTTS